MHGMRSLGCDRNKAGNTVKVKYGINGSANTAG